MPLDLLTRLDSLRRVRCRCCFGRFAAFQRHVRCDPRVELTEKERVATPATYGDGVTKLAGFFRRTPARVPLPICLNKLDRWGPLLEPGSALHEIASPAPAGRADEGRDDLIYEEARSALRRWGQMSFLEHLAIDFPAHRLLACSVLGDAAQGRDDAPQPLPTPLLVDRPILWLLRRQGLLPREARR